MVMSVTQRGGIQAVGRPFLGPQAINTGINLTKAVGTPITLQWAARNNGTGPDIVNMAVYEGQVRTTRVLRGGSQSFTVQPGQTQPLDISGNVLSSWTQNTPLPAALVIESPPGVVVEEAFFTLTVTGAVGPAFQVGDTVAYILNTLSVNNNTIAPIQSIITPRTTPGWTIYEINGEPVREWNIHFDVDASVNTPWQFTHLFRVGDTITFTQFFNQTNQVVRFTEQITVLFFNSSTGRAAYGTTNSTGFPGLAGAEQTNVFATNTPEPM